MARRERQRAEISSERDGGDGEGERGRERRVERLGMIY